MIISSPTVQCLHYLNPVLFTNTEHGTMRHPPALLLQK